LSSVLLTAGHFSRALDEASYRVSKGKPWRQPREGLGLMITEKRRLATMPFRESASAIGVILQGQRFAGSGSSIRGCQRQGHRAKRPLMRRATAQQRTAARGVRRLTDGSRPEAANQICESASAKQTLASTLWAS
jgi:hypothetical protein